MRIWRKTDLAWAAGFIDGEGNIATRQIKNLTRRGRTGVFATELTVCQTNEEILLGLKELFGVGSVYQCKWIRGNSRPAWRWTVTGQKVARVLRLVKPYLKLKKEQAEIVLEMCKRKVDSRSGWAFDSHKVSDEEIAERRVLVQRIKILNKRGIR